MKSIEDLQVINQGSVDSMKALRDEIDRQLGDPNLDLSDEARLTARRVTLTSQINNQELVQAHLRAARITVEFTAQQEADLDQLNARIDRAILNGLRANALLELASKAVTAAQGISDSVLTHTG